MEGSRVFGSETPSTAWHAYVASTLKHLTDARRIFMDDVRQFVTLTLVLFLGSGLLGSYTLQFVTTPLEACILYCSALIVLFLIFPVTTAIEAKAEAAYELYIAAAIHGALVHKAVGIDDSHQWFTYVERVISEIDAKDFGDTPDLESEESIDKFKKFVEKNWKVGISTRWKKTGASFTNTRNRNLLESFQSLLRWARRVTVCAMLLGLLFSVVHVEGMIPRTPQSNDDSSLVEKKQTTPADQLPNQRKDEDPVIENAKSR